MVPKQFGYVEWSDNHHITLLNLDSISVREQFVFYFVGKHYLNCVFLVLSTQAQHVILVLFHTKDTFELYS